MSTEDAAGVTGRVIRGWGQVVPPGWRDLFCRRLSSARSSVLRPSRLPPSAWVTQLLRDSSSIPSCLEMRGITPSREPVWRRSLS